MRSSQHDRNSPPPEFRAERISMQGARSVKGDTDQIYRHIEIDGLDRLVDMQYVPVRRHKCCEIGHRDLLKIQHACPPHPADLGGRSRNQQEAWLSHAGSRREGFDIRRSPFEAFPTICGEFPQNELFHFATIVEYIRRNSPVR